MKKLIIGILLLIMAAIPQYTQAATYNGNMIQDVNEYVFSDSRVNYYIDWIAVLQDGGFQVRLSQELKDPNDIVTKGMVYGDFTFVYGMYRPNEWQFSASSASEVGVANGFLAENSIAQSVFNVAYPYAEQIMSQMRADNAEVVRRNAEREQQRKEQEKQDAIAEEAAEKILDKTDDYLEAKKYDEAIQLANKAIEIAPRHDMGYIVKANAYCAKRDYSTAIAVLTDAIKSSLFPTDNRGENFKLATLFFKRAMIYEGTGKFIDARRDYAEALRLNLQNSELEAEAKRKVESLRSYLGA